MTVCMSVCMYVCIYVFMCLFIYACVVPLKSPADHVGECYLLNIADNLADSVSLGHYFVTVQR